jgi:hypothetical protein
MHRCLVGESSALISPPHSHLHCSCSRLRPPLSSPSRAAIVHPHRRPSEGSSPPWSPPRVAPSSSPSWWPTTPGECFFPPPASSARAHRRRSSSILLWLRSDREKDYKRTSFLSDPQATTGDPLSTPSSTFSPPPLAHPSEHLFLLGPKFEPPWRGRAPQPHLRYHLTTDRLDLSTSRRAVEGIGFPYFSWPSAKMS